MKQNGYAMIGTLVTVSIALFTYFNVRIASVESTVADKAERVAAVEVKAVATDTKVAELDNKTDKRLSRIEDKIDTILSKIK